MKTTFSKKDIETARKHKTAIVGMTVRLPNGSRMEYSNLYIPGKAAKDLYLQTFGATEKKSIYIKLKSEGKL